MNVQQIENLQISLESLIEFEAIGYLEARDESLNRRVGNISLKQLEDDKNRGELN